MQHFRSPGGVWSKYRTVFFDEFLASAEARHEYWRQKCEMHADFVAAQPNVGHKILARWESAGRIRGIITQNIDGLHKIAGTSEEKLVELHGTDRWVTCLKCAKRQARSAERYEAIRVYQEQKRAARTG